MVIGTIDSFNFIPLLVTLTLRGCQRKAKALGFIFFAHVSSSQDEIWYGVEVVEHPNTTFEWDLLKQGKLLFHCLHKKI